MHDKQIPEALRGLIKAMQQHPADSPVGLILDNLLPDTDSALAWLALQARRALLPVVFSLEVPGYVWLGLEGDTNPVPDPDLAGLSAAWEIFLHGENAPFVLFAADRGMTPNGLRNALERAAVWAERHCTALAVAIRSISVEKDGSARFAPTYPMKLQLHVFSACSGSMPAPYADRMGAFHQAKESPP